MQKLFATAARAGAAPPTPVTIKSALELDTILKCSALHTKTTTLFKLFKLFLPQCEGEALDLFVSPRWRKWNVNPEFSLVLFTIYHNSASSSSEGPFQNSPYAKYCAFHLKRILNFWVAYLRHICIQLIPSHKQGLFCFKLFKQHYDTHILCALDKYLLFICSWCDI